MRMAVLLVALALGACTGTGPRYAGESFMSNAAIQAADDQECRSYGVLPGSDGYVRCRMALQQGRARGEVARRNAQMRLGTALMGF